MQQSPFSFVIGKTVQTNSNIFSEGIPSCKQTNKPFNAVHPAESDHFAQAYDGETDGRRVSVEYVQDVRSSAGGEHGRQQEQTCEE